MDLNFMDLNLRHKCFYVHTVQQLIQMYSYCLVCNSDIGFVQLLLHFLFRMERKHKLLLTCLRDLPQIKSN